MALDRVTFKDLLFVRTCNIDSILNIDPIDSLTQNGARRPSQKMLLNVIDFFMTSKSRRFCLAVHVTMEMDISDMSQHTATMAGLSPAVSKTHVLYSISTLTYLSDIWFRALIKLVGEGPSVPSRRYKKNHRKKPKKGSPLYIWYEMTFFTRWTPANCITLCIDTPADMPFELKAIMTSDEKMKSLDISDPFSMYVPLLDLIIKLYDESVWSMRDMIRPIEKVSLLF
jgi:hypothetical protein